MAKGKETSVRTGEETVNTIQHALQTYLDSLLKEDQTVRQTLERACIEMDGKLGSIDFEFHKSLGEAQMAFQKAFCEAENSAEKINQAHTAFEAAREEIGRRAAEAHREACEANRQFVGETLERGDAGTVRCYRECLAQFGKALGAADPQHLEPEHLEALAHMLLTAAGHERFAAFVRQSHGEIGK